LDINASCVVKKVSNFLWIRRERTVTDTRMLACNLQLPAALYSQV
jgi:hypothetical protein